MEPSEKSEAVEQHITTVFGVDRRATIKADMCTFCSKEAKDFRNQRSRKEYIISGMCQTCQDDFFGLD